MTILIWLPVNLDKLLEEHDASGAVAFCVKGWRPSGKAHHVWHNHQYYEKTVNIREDASCSHTKKSCYQDDPTDTRFSWEANFEGKLTAVVVHSCQQQIRMPTPWNWVQNQMLLYPPQLYMRLSTFLTDSLSRTCVNTVSSSDILYKCYKKKNCREPSPRWPDRFPHWLKLPPSLTCGTFKFELKEHFLQELAHMLSVVISREQSWK